MTRWWCGEGSGCEREGMVGEREEVEMKDKEEKSRKRKSKRGENKSKNWRSRWNE